MASSRDLIAQIDDLFNARSVAIVGVPRGLKTGSVFLTALLEQGYSGRIYPVNPRAGEIAGLKAYPSVSDIPGPVDLAIVLVPQSKALEVVHECIAKGVKGAVLFTAGFSETGTSQGQALEDEIVKTARGCGIIDLLDNSRSLITQMPRQERQGHCSDDIQRVLATYPAISDTHFELFMPDFPKRYVLEDRISKFFNDERLQFSYLPS